MIAQTLQLVIDLGADAMGTEEGVDGEGKIEHGAARRHRLEVALGGHNEYLAGIEVQLDGVEEIHRIWLRIVQYLLDGREPAVEFVLAVFGLLASFLIFPMGCKTLLRNLVHTARTDLQLYPAAALRHKRCLQSLIAVGLRM